MSEGFLDLRARRRGKVKEAFWQVVVDPDVFEGVSVQIAVHIFEIITDDVKTLTAYQKFKLLYALVILFRFECDHIVSIFVMTSWFGIGYAEIFPEIADA